MTNTMFGRAGELSAVLAPESINTAATAQVSAGTNLSMFTLELHVAGMDASQALPFSG
jgi:hypothetical protein